MLGKLLKYEIPALGRKLVPLFIAWAATAVMIGILVGPAQAKSSFMMILSVLIYIVVGTAIFVMTVIMIIQRYKNSLLGDEAYFNMVLPVSASAHIANKLISALIWIILTAVTAFLTVLIITSFDGGHLDFYIDWKAFFESLNAKTVVAGLEWILIILAGFTKTVMQIYTAITIGHQAKQHVTLMSIGAYIGILIAEGLVSRLLLAVFPAMFRTSVNSFEDVRIILLPALATVLIFSAVYFFICKYLMEKKLNL